MVVVILSLIQSPLILVLHSVSITFTWKVDNHSSLVHHVLVYLLFCFVLSSTLFHLFAVNLLLVFVLFSGQLNPDCVCEKSHQSCKCV